MPTPSSSRVRAPTALAGLFLLIALAVVPAVAASSYRVGLLAALGTDAANPSLLQLAHRLAINEMTAAGVFGADTVTITYQNLTNAGVGAAAPFFRSLQAGSYGLDPVANPPTDIIIGPVFSSEATVSGSVLGTLGIPQIAPSATAGELSDKNLYPLFSRTIPSSPSQARALAFLCQRMGWHKVSMISTTDAFGASFVEGYSLAAKQLGISIVGAQAFATGSTNPKRIADLVSLVRDSGAWIIMLFLTGADYTAVIAALMEQNMHLPPYQIVYPTAIVQNIPAGAIGFDIFINTTSPRYVQYASALSPLANYRPLGGYTTALAYDGTYLAGYALQKYSAIKASCPVYPTQTFVDGPLPTDICQYYATHTKGKTLWKLITNTTFIGASGPVELSSVGDRLGKFWITNSRNQSLTPVRVGWVDMSEASPVINLEGFPAPVFADGTTEIPLDHFMPRKGDNIPVTINGSYWVLAFGISVLGAWTALILIEQAVWNYGHVPLHSTLLWTLASATALTIGLWSSICIGLTAPQFSLLPDTQLSYHAVEVFSSLLVAWPACFIAFALMIPTLRSRNVPRTNNSELEGMSRMDTNTTNESAIEKSGTQQMEADTALATIKALNEAKLKAAEERRANRCCKYSKQAVPWSVAAGSLSLGISGVHFLIWSSLELAVDSHISIGISLGGLAIGFVVGGVALAMFFHFRTSRWRWFSAFVMAAAIDGAHFTYLGAATYTYSGSTPTHDLMADVIQIIAAVLTCIACFVFIGLNVIRLRLSKDVLDRFLIQAQKKIRTLEVVAQHRDHMLTERDTLLQLIAGVRPLVRANHPMLHQLLKQYAPGKYDAANPNGGMGTGEQEMDPDAADHPNAVNSAAAAYVPSSPGTLPTGASATLPRSMTRTGTGNTTTADKNSGRSSPPLNPTSGGSPATMARGARASVAYQVNADKDAPPTPSRGGLELTSLRGASSVASAGGVNFGLNSESPVVTHHTGTMASMAAATGSTGGGSGTNTPLLATRVSGAQVSAASSSGPNGPIAEDAHSGSVAITIGTAGPGGPGNETNPMSGPAVPVPGAVPSAAAAAAAAAAGPRPGSAPRPVGAEHSPKTSFNQLPKMTGAMAGASTPEHKASPAAAGAGGRRAHGLLGSDAHPDTQPASAGRGPALPTPSKVTFADILSNPVCLEIFKDTVASNHNSENVAFLLDVERYRRVADDNDDPAAPEQRRVLALDIATTYFGAVDVVLGVPGHSAAPHAINIAATVRDQVLDDVRREKFTPKLFDAPFHEVRRLLERNDFARFVETPAFTVCGALLIITQQLQDRLALGAAQARGKAAEMLEGSILKGRGTHKGSSNLFGSDKSRGSAASTDSGAVVSQRTTARG